MFSLFLTAVTATAQTPVPPPFAVLAGAGITNTGPTTITGDVGSYPTLTQTGFSTVTMVDGTNHGGDGVTQAAQTGLVTAYNVAAGRGATTVLSELGNQALGPGVYDSADGTFGITGTLTLNGGANDVFIFKAASTLITAAGAPGLPASKVVLNGVQPCNVFWQVGSSATLGTYSIFQGSILALTSITATTGATVNGRLLARNGAVTLDTNTITGCAVIEAPEPPPPSLGLSCAASTGQLGTVYSSAMIVTGQTGPYTFGIISGSVPPGLALNTSSGAITGTPITPGSFSFAVRVRNSSGVEGKNSSCTITIVAAGAPLSPDLTITESHLGNFQQGGTGSYTIVASNLGPGPTAGTVAVSERLPAGLTATAISGTGWSCTLPFLSCTRGDALAAGASYEPITVTVNVANNLLIGNPGGNGLTFQPDDILLSMKDGTVQWRRSDWTLVKIITSNTDGQAKGMALDASGNLFVTHYFGTGLSGNDVMKFDPNGNLIGPFGSSTYDCNPGSIVFDKSGNAYVGHADCSGNIFKLDSHGNLLARYNVTIENRGSSHILLGPDQCTMYYTSEGPNVKRFNVCTNTQMPDFNTAPLPDAIEGAEQFALLPGGGLLVANFSVIARLDASGNLVRTYNAPGDTHCWLGMALDTDGTSFWASNWCDSFATRFDLATGNVIESHVASDTQFMVKQIMVVPSGPGAVVINTATVSGGGEVNISNDSASDSTTIVTQTQAPLFSSNSTAYCVGSAWSLGLSNAVPNALVRLMGTTNGQSWVVAPWATTDANGRLSLGGTFADGTQGSYTLRVDDGKVSNTIYFVVSNCGQ